MRIAIASGKGGTGKTTIAVNLALSLVERESVQFIDCDVEEPNAHIFLKPRIKHVHSVEKLLPEVDESLCNQCGECAKACEFNAIAVIGKKVLVYNELCHGCGLCKMVCPTGAISEVPHELGVVESGEARGFPFSRGLLNIGEAMATPIVHTLKEGLDPDRLAILDAPPGTGCPTIAALHGADVALLVTEPTPFGLHDLKAAVGVARSLKLPIAVIINRNGIGDDQVERYCEQEGLPIPLKIPFDREIAVLYSEGTPLVDALPAWKERFIHLYHEIISQVGEGAASVASGFMPDDLNRRRTQGATVHAAEDVPAVDIGPNEGPKKGEAG